MAISDNDEALGLDHQPASEPEIATFSDSDQSDPLFGPEFDLLDDLIPSSDLPPPITDADTIIPASRTLLTASAPQTQALAPVPVSKSLQRRQKRADKYIDELSNQYIESLGDNENLKKVLISTKDDRGRRLLALMAQPNLRKHSLSRLAKMAQIEPLEFFAMFREFYGMEAAMVMAKGMPEVATDIVADSYSTEIECQRCDGEGKVERKGEETVCPRCHGSGLQRKPGDPDARRLMAEAVGWTKRGGLSVNVDARSGSFGVDSVIEELERSNQSGQGSGSKIIDIG